MSYKLANGFATIAVLVGVAVVVGVLSIVIVKQDDQVIEEVSESVIEMELGLPQGTIDLTPDSPE